MINVASLFSACNEADSTTPVLVRLRPGDADDKLVQVASVTFSWETGQFVIELDRPPASDKPPSQGTATAT